MTRGKFSRGFKVQAVRLVTDRGAAAAQAARDLDVAEPPITGTNSAHCLDAQLGFLMRKATQRHPAIFAAHIPDLTPTQFAALGRATAMDAATIKGVVDGVRVRGLVVSAPDPGDSRRMFLRPTREGRAAFEGGVEQAHAITRETPAPRVLGTNRPRSCG